MIVITYHTICSNPDIALRDSQLIIHWGSSESLVYDYIKPSLAQKAWEELTYAISKQKGQAVIDMRLFELFDHARYELRKNPEAQLELHERISGQLVLRPDYLPQESGLMARERFIRGLEQAQLLKH